MYVLSLTSNMPKLKLEVAQAKVRGSQSRDSSHKFWKSLSTNYY